MTSNGSPRHDQPGCDAAPELARTTSEMFRALVTSWLGILSGAELRVALVYIYHANHKTGEAWPSLARIAALTNLTRRTAERAIHQLQDRGILRVVKKGGGRNKTTMRRVVLYVKSIEVNPGASDGVLAHGNPGTGDAKPRRPGPQTPAPASQNPDVGAGENKQMNNGENTPTTTSAVAAGVVNDGFLVVVVRKALLKSGFVPRDAEKMLTTYADQLEDLARVILLSRLAVGVKNLPGWIRGLMQQGCIDFSRLVRDGDYDIRQVVARLSNWVRAPALSPSLALKRLPAGSDPQAEKVRQYQELMKLQRHEQREPQ